MLAGAYLRSSVLAGCFLCAVFILGIPPSRRKVSIP